MRPWGRILLSAAKQWNADNAFKHSSAVSFTTLFSLAPVTALVAELASAVLGRQQANAALQRQLTELIGKDSAQMLQQSSEKAVAAAHGSWITATVSIAVFIFGATAVFAQLQESLNSIWQVHQRPSRSGWLVLLSHRLVSFAMVLSLGFLLLVSLVLTTGLSLLTAHFGSSIHGRALASLDFAVSFAAITVLFALLLKIMPDVELRWPEVWRAGIATSVLFTAGRFGISVYLAHSTVASVYGAAGSLVALLIWIYYSSAIFFYGAELVKADRAERHRPVQPSQVAVRDR